MPDKNLTTPTSPINPAPGARLSAMSATTPENDTKKYDEDAEYLYYDQKLMEGLKQKSPEKFKDYMSQIVAKRRKRLDKFNYLLAQRKAGVEIPAAAFVPTYDDLNYPQVPENYTESLSEAEMKKILGEKGFSRFQELRKLPRLGGYETRHYSNIAPRIDFSYYGPEDLKVEKVVSRSKGDLPAYEGKFIPPMSVTQRAGETERFGSKVMRKL